MIHLYLLSPDHLYFESYLESAAMKRQVVQFLTLENQQGVMFVDKILYLEDGIMIRTSTGDLIPKQSLAGIWTDQDPGDLGSIHCLCE